MKSDDNRKKSSLKGVISGYLISAPIDMKIVAQSVKLESVLTLLKFTYLAFWQFICQNAQNT